MQKSKFLGENGQKLTYFREEILTSLNIIWTEENIIKVNRVPVPRIVIVCTLIFVKRVVNVQSFMWQCTSIKEFILGIDCISYLIKLFGAYTINRCFCALQQKGHDLATT